MSPKETLFYKQKIALTVRKRLEGASITEIADDAGCTRQNTYKIIRNFKNMGIDGKFDPTLKMPPIEKQVQFALAMYNGDTLEGASRFAHITQQQGVNVILKITTQKSFHESAKTKTIDSTLDDYRRKNDLTIPQFAERCGISAAYMRLILKGEANNLSEELAEKIHAATGMEISDFT